MLKNLLKVALRNLQRNKLYSLINILGFSLGLAVFILITMIVIDDVSFDRFHDDPQNIYRLVTTNKASRKVDAVTSGALIRAADAEVPEVDSATRVHNFGTINLTFFGAPESEAGIQREVIGADSNFFKVFSSFKILAGDPDNQLKDPQTAMITWDVAHALFGDENPIGKLVQQDENDPGLTISGIVSDCPRNSHIQYDIIIPAVITPQNAVWWDSWDNIAVYGYIRTRDGVSREMLESKIRQVGELHGLNVQYLPTLQPLNEVHLGSSGFLFDNFNFGKSDRNQVLVLSIIALLTLLIASFNFINLSSARAIKRAREVGMRKVVGARREQLITQFLGESVLLTLIAMVAAATIVQVSLPYLEQFIRKQITVSLANSLTMNLGLMIVTVAIGLIAGIYPSLVLAGFKPVIVLKGAFRSSKHGVALRQILVVLQFSISIALIACVIIVLQQLHYIRFRDPGFMVDSTLLTFTFNPQAAQGREAFMNELRKIPTIEAVGSTSSVPGAAAFGRYEGRGEDSETNENEISFVRIPVGADFIPALGIKITTGRNFSSMSPDSGQSVILNETAIRKLGWTGDPIGRRIILLEPDGSYKQRTVVGVVNDFQYADARQKIDPLMLEYLPQGGGFVLFRAKGGTMEETIAGARAVWERVFPDLDFNYQFLDERIDRLYQRDREFASKIGVFSTLAIIIAALGLLGLTSYSTEQRRREIAVRKVLGSSEQRIVMLLSIDFVRWVLLANVIAWPVAYLAMQQWLAEFQFRMTVTFMPFVIAGVAALIIAMITVSALAWRASLANPANVLHQE